MAIQAVTVTRDFKLNPARLEFRQRLLYADKFSDEFHPAPDPVYGLTSIEEVMAHFKPEVTVILTDQEGSISAETFSFRGLNDFTPKRFIEQSQLLRLLKADGSEAAQNLLVDNVRQVLEETRALEITYRSLALFFENTAGNQHIVIIDFVNVQRDQLDVKDVWSYDTIHHISRVLHSRYNRFFSIDEKYTVLVVPGALPNKLSMDVFVRIASDHKALLITDFFSLDSALETLALFRQTGLPTDCLCYAHALMVVNQAVSRPAYAEWGETTPIPASLSPALAGVIARSSLFVSTTEIEFSTLTGVSTLQYDLNPGEIDQLTKAGLITASAGPEGSTLSSAVTMYQSDNDYLSTNWATVRITDWMEQGIRHLLDQHSTENWTWRTEKELTIETMQFLNTLKGPRLFLQSYGIPQFTKDPVQRGRLVLSVEITLNHLSAAYTLYFHGEAERDAATGLRSAWRA